MLVSLKKVIFFNKNGLSVFVDLLEALHKENGIIVGFCDFDDKKYASIMTFYHDNINFSLFRYSFTC